MVSAYARRFIDMYSISFIGNALLNKLMTNVLSRIYEIFFTCFPQQRGQNIRDYKGRTQEFLINLKFYKIGIEESKLFKAKVEEIMNKAKNLQSNFLHYFIEFIYGTDVAYQLATYTYIEERIYDEQ